MENGRLKISNEWKFQRYLLPDLKNSFSDFLWSSMNENFTFGFRTITATTEKYTKEKRKWIFHIQKMIGKTASFFNGIESIVNEFCNKFKFKNSPTVMRKLAEIRSSIFQQWVTTECASEYVQLVISVCECSVLPSIEWALNSYFLIWIDCMNCSCDGLLSLKI